MVRGMLGEQRLTGTGSHMARWCIMGTLLTLFTTTEQDVMVVDIYIEH